MLDSVPSSSRQSGEHIAALDGIRGTAALLVVVSHLDGIGLTTGMPKHAGSIGVIVFFILSGFLMGHLYLHRPFEPRAVLRYAAARAARVLPLYYAVVLGSYVLSLLIGQDYTFYLDFPRLVRQLFMVGSAHVFWSIPPEVEFYAVFLLPWWLVATSRIVPLAPLLLLGTAVLITVEPLFPGITVFNKLHIFLAGVGVAGLRNWIGPGRVSPAVATICQFIGLGCAALLVSHSFPGLAD